MAKSISLTRYLVEQQRVDGLIPSQLRLLLEVVARACKSISHAVNKGALGGVLGTASSENVQGEITMLRSYALALQNSGKNEELLALAAANPVVLHQKTLYPALGELAKNYSDTKPEEAALIAEAAVHVNAYPDREVRTPFERLLLGDYDENALRPYRGANCVEMLCKQGYTEEQAKKEGRKVETSKFPWAASGRAIANGADYGFTKLIFDAETHRVIGGAIVGPSAGDMIGEVCLAIEMGCDAVDIGKTIHPHPTLGETVGMAAEVAHGTCTDVPPPRKK